MNVAIVAHSPVPFRTGGAERLVQGLATALCAAGHGVEVVKLPARELRLDDLLVSYEQFAMLDLSHFDVVITGRYPAWMVDHPHHVVWMMHPLRGLYDTYPHGRLVDQRLPDLPSARRLAALLDRVPVVDQREVFDAAFAAVDALDPAGPDLEIPSPLARMVVHALDRIALDPRRVRRHAAISATVARREDYFPPGVEPLVLHPPVHLPASDGPPGDAFLVVSRLERPKRVDLVIDAFRRSRSAARLIVAGDGADSPRLQELAAADPRIELTGPVDDERLAELYAEARAVVFCPRDEDYGYVAAEALAHGRPVITTGDAGGPTELVTDGTNGLVVAPDADALAAAIVTLARDEPLARRLGEAGRDRVARMRWDRVVDALTAARSPRRRRGGPPRLVALSTYPLFPQQSGGQLRGRHLLAAACADRGLAAQVVSVTHRSSVVERHELAPGVAETVVPLSARHRDAETRMRLVTGPVSITDVATGLVWRATPALVRELDAAFEQAAAVMLVQPYLAPAALDLAPEVPVICDAHNHERAMKAGMYPSNEGGRWLLGKVLEIERAAVRAAALVTAVTEADLASLVSEYGVDRELTAVIPNGVDTSGIPFVTGEDRARRRSLALNALGLHPATQALALFVGSGHGPNTEAGRELIELAPELAQVELLLVGRHADELHRAHLPSNVHLLGVVSQERLDLLLAGCDVALNPIRTGGGSNLKLLTYLAAGLPVISSSVGARGVDAAAAGVLICEPDGLGSAIGEVLGPAGQARAERGRRYVEERADWTAIGADLRRLVDKIVSP